MTEDIIHRFSFAAAPIRGQWVRLDATLAALFAHKPYPPAIKALLAEMLAASSMMADGIKLRGAVALQARGTGPVTTVLAECRELDRLRGIARWTEDAPLDPAAGTLSELLGDGQMAITLTPDRDDIPDATAYQGVVSLGAGSLAASLEQYFETSEQLPTRLFLSFDGSQVTGLLIQRLPAAANATEEALDEHEALWQEAEMLAATLRMDELARWSVTELLQRLFHEHPLTLQPGRTLQFSCTCNRARAEQMLAALPKAEIIELLETRGMLDVTCEICGQRYEYDQIDTRLLYEPGTPRVH